MQTFTTEEPALHFSSFFFYSYLKAAKLNDTILIEGKVLRAGRQLAFLEGNVYLKDAKKDSLLNRDLLVATGTHTKYII